MNVKWYIKRSILFQLVRLEETQTGQGAHCAAKRAQIGPNSAHLGWDYFGI